MSAAFCFMLFMSWICEWGAVTSCIISVQEFSGSHFPCLFMCSYQHLRHLMSIDLFKNFHFTAIFVYSNKKECKEMKIRIHFCVITSHYINLFQLTGPLVITSHYVNLLQLIGPLSILNACHIILTVTIPATYPHNDHAYHIIPMVTIPFTMM